ncbi:MAG: tRNA preQ1(34) S-adenosylmethionine ribosyltransferase-isomerase QueA [Christensenellaceae bacterium]|nr:tRNA preQ1(34) S-adenosylmethionine ribosyltransferase-isomerase QueA [Christensenellaceae bacterium]
MNTSDFYYDLPESLIAQSPASPRDSSRMLVCDIASKKRKHDIFRQFPDFLTPKDVLVINETKVIPARLIGVKESSDVVCEVLLLKRIDTTHWEALVKPGRRLKPGAQVLFGNGKLKAKIINNTDFGGRIIEFQYKGVFENLLDELGETPLPPYIHKKLENPSDYQTVYAVNSGSAAAPTAGLHFTEELLSKIRQKGVDIVPITLHVGLGTFRPVKAERIEEHNMHSEYYYVSENSAERINKARKQGGRICCVGTTCVRTLESVADSSSRVIPGSGETNIFITPGYSFKALDMLLTNFHLPESTLLMLVSAFMGREYTLETYKEAVNEKYRFFSFGDCMLIGKNLL